MSNMQFSHAGPPDAEVYQEAVVWFAGKQIKDKSFPGAVHSELQTTTRGPAPTSNPAPVNWTPTWPRLIADKGDGARW